MRLHLRSTIELVKFGLINSKNVAKESEQPIVD
jgi:hypothetical protein